MPGLVRALERDRRETVLRLVRVDASLNHLDLDLVVRLVVHLHGAMPRAAVVVAGIDVLRKFAAVPGARAVSTSISMSPSSVWTTTCGNAAPRCCAGVPPASNRGISSKTAKHDVSHQVTPQADHESSTADPTRRAAPDVIGCAALCRAPASCECCRSESVRRRELELPSGEDVGSARVLAELGFPTSPM